MQLLLIGLKARNVPWPEDYFCILAGVRILQTGQNSDFALRQPACKDRPSEECKKCTSDECKKST
jgi:hypothetical protein